MARRANPETVFVRAGQSGSKDGVARLWPGNAILDEPVMKARIAGLGGVSMKGAPADFGKTLADETEKWEKVVKFAGAKVE